MTHTSLGCCRYNEMEYEEGLLTLSALCCCHFDYLPVLSIFCVRFSVLGSGHSELRESWFCILEHRSAQCAIKTLYHVMGTASSNYLRL